jgi:hypothetical protein
VGGCLPEAGRGGSAARRWFEAEASTAAMAATLAGVLNDIATSNGATAGTRNE